MATNLYKYYSHTQLILGSFCKKLECFFKTRPIVESLARSTILSSTTLFSNNRKVQRARPLGGLEQAKAVWLPSRRQRSARPPASRVACGSTPHRSPLPPVACAPGRPWMGWSPTPPRSCCRSTHRQLPRHPPSTKSAPSAAAGPGSFLSESGLPVAPAHPRSTAPHTSLPKSPSQP